MVPRLDLVVNEYCQKASKLHNSYLKSQKSLSYTLPLNPPFRDVDSEVALYYINYIEFLDLVMHSIITADESS